VHAAVCMFACAVESADVSVCQCECVSVKVCMCVP